jgi:F-type H+-transporting ATPase subunit b
MLAAGHDGEGKTDIVPRVINFAIFATILYYLLAKPIKEFFTGRTTEIADRLSSIQDKLKASKDEKDKALKGVQEADENAADIINVAKKEAEMLTKKIEENLEQDLINLEKSYEDRMEIETKKTKRSVVEEVINEMLSEKVSLSNDELVNIINKKVA